VKNDPSPQSGRLEKDTDEEKLIQSELSMKIYVQAGLLFPALSVY